MSRAFVDEHAGEGREEGVPPLKLPLPPGARNYMTAKGAGRLAAELEALRRERRPKLAEAAAAEPKPGAAKRALLECDRRIDYLARMNSLLEVVDPSSQRPDRVLFGATVTVLESPGGERTVRIVGVDEADPGSGSVSWVSPVARALVGTRVGDRVRADLPSGPVSMTVLSISYGAGSLGGPPA